MKTKDAQPLSIRTCQNGIVVSGAILPSPHAPATPGLTFHPKKSEDYVFNDFGEFCNFLEEYFLEEADIEKRAYPESVCVAMEKSRNHFKGDFPFAIRKPQPESGIVNEVNECFIGMGMSDTTDEVSGD